MDRTMQSDRTNKARIVVKATVSEDLSGKVLDRNVAKLRYLHKKNEKFNEMHIRSDIALPSRSRERSHGLSQDMGHEGLSSTGLMQSRQSSVDGQPGNQHARRLQIQERLDQRTREELALLTAQERRDLANRLPNGQSTIRTSQSLSAQTSITQPTNGPSTGSTFGLGADQDFQMQVMLLEQRNKKRLMMARLEQDQKKQDTGSEQIKEMGRAPFELSPSVKSASSNLNRSLRRR